MKGIEVCNDPSKLKDVISIFDKKKNQTITTNRLSNEEIKEILNQSRRNIFFLNVSEKDIELGGEIKYKRIVRGYKLINIEGLRKITTINKMRYRKDKQISEKNTNAGSEYG